MTSRAQACACHDHLGSARTAVPDDVLRKLKGVSIPSISLILRRLGYPSTFLSGLAPRTSAQSFAGRAMTARALPTRDAFSRSKVEAGHALADAYPLSEALRAEYEATRAREKRAT